MIILYSVTLNKNTYSWSCYCSNWFQNFVNN